MERVSDFEVIIPKDEEMKVDATLFVSDKIKLENDAVSQLRDACKIPSVKRVIATPDIHVGYGVPIGCVVGTEEVIIPAAAQLSFYAHSKGIIFNGRCDNRQKAVGIKWNKCCR